MTTRLTKNVARVVTIHDREYELTLTREGLMFRPLRSTHRAFLAYETALVRAEGAPQPETRRRGRR